MKLKFDQMEFEIGELITLRSHDPATLHGIVLSEPWTDHNNEVRVTVFIVEKREEWIPYIQSIKKIKGYENEA
jgi:hypothetical protein